MYKTVRSYNYISQDFGRGNQCKISVGHNNTSLCSKHKIKIKIKIEIKMLQSVFLLIGVIVQLSEGNYSKLTLPYR